MASTTKRSRYCLRPTSCRIHSQAVG
jgi:hypothetical protein